MTHSTLNETKTNQPLRSQLNSSNHLATDFCTNSLVIHTTIPMP